jgi:hypothetical protein
MMFLPDRLLARYDAILTHNLSEIVGNFNHTGKASPTFLFKTSSFFLVVYGGALLLIDTLSPCDNMSW